MNVSAGVDASILPIVLGLPPEQWLTLLGIVVGPIVAVLITLAVEARRRARDQKLEVFRSIMMTRHLAGDPNYSNAINLIPLAFHNSKKVKAEYRRYMQETATDGLENPDEETVEKIKRSQKTLIVAMAKDLGFRLDEEDLQAYAADSLIFRDNVIMDGYRAWREIALSLQAQTRLLLGETRESILGLTPKEEPESDDENAPPD